MKFTAKFLTTTKPMSEEWKSDLEKMQGAILKGWPTGRKLRDKLLSIGGEEALVAPAGHPVLEADLSRLLTRGQLWPGKAKFVKMRSNNCHGNSRELWEKGKGDVVYGFALSEDGLWREHSWVKTKNGLIETTVPRVAYFGAVLNPAEVESEYPQT